MQENKDILREVNLTIYLPQPSTTISASSNGLQQQCVLVEIIETEGKDTRWKLRFAKINKENKTINM